MKRAGVWLAAVLTIGLVGCGTASPGGATPGDASPRSSAVGTEASSHAAGNAAKADNTGTAPQEVTSTSSGANGNGNSLTMDELKQKKNLWIDCDLSKQRIYIKDGDQILKEMVTSSGLDTNPDNTTPRGTFQILPYRDTWFYNPQVQEGAMYWVAFKGTEFLFHSVPMDQNQHIIESEAQKLGHKASHGCFRLSLADAKWFYDNIPVGTKVVIHD
jgi:lipoprotein-anchoring transpeptidase ErfK/SrfK